MFTSCVLYVRWSWRTNGIRWKRIEKYTFCFIFYFAIPIRRVNDLVQGKNNYIKSTQYKRESTVKFSFLLNEWMKRGKQKKVQCILVLLSRGNKERKNTISLVNWSIFGIVPLDTDTKKKFKNRERQASVSSLELIRNWLNKVEEKFFWNTYLEQVCCYLLPLYLCRVVFVSTTSNISIPIRRWKKTGLNVPCCRFNLFKT